MLILTESNNPFKEQELGFHMPEALQEMMEESGISFELFDEEFAFSDNNTYLFAMLYEAECAWNEIWGGMVNKTIQTYLNEQTYILSEEDQRTFWQSIKAFFKKLWTGVANFFKRIWAAIANDKKLFLSASQNVPDDATSNEPEYTTGEAAEYNKIILDHTNKMANLNKELDGLKANPSATSEQFNSVTQRIDAANSERDKALEGLKQKVESRKKAENKMNAQQIRTEIQNIANDNTTAQTLKTVEQVSNSVAQSAIKDTENGEKSANQAAPAPAPQTQGQQQPQQKNVTQKSNLSVVVDCKKKIAVSMSVNAGKLSQMRDARGRFVKSYNTPSNATAMANSSANITVNGQQAQQPAQNAQQ